MKIMTTLRKGLVSARAGAAAAFITAALIMGAYTQPALSAQVGSAPKAAASVTVPFNGKSVYDAAFKDLRDNHYTLVDPAARAAFVATWEHKHDNDNVLSTEKGTDMAVYEMMWSLGQRFDYYFPPAQTTAEHEEETATIAGIGLSMEEDGLVKAIKALGPKPTEAQVDPLLKFSDERPLVAGDTPDNGTPAAKAHIAKGDRIIAVDGNSVNGKTLEQVSSTVRGTVGTRVTLTISHKNASGTVVTSKVVLTRAKITVHVVKTDNEGRISHIRLTNFMSQFGTEEMAEALETAAQSNTAGVILDLRGNPGGRLDQVLDMAQMFIDNGVLLKQVERNGDHMITITYSVTHANLVVTTQSDDGSAADVEKSERIPVLIPATTPVLVLVDENSASASEILSGALQANGRARVIGQPSYGKGVGQIVVQLPLGRSMHVTNFEFFPGGVKMDWVGIVPDIEVKLPADADIIEDPSSDTQLAAAKLELIYAAIGYPTPERSQADIDARRAELEKTHKANFQQEVKERQEMLKKAADAAAKGSSATVITPPTKPTTEPNQHK